MRDVPPTTRAQRRALLVTTGSVALLALIVWWFAVALPTRVDPDMLGEGWCVRDAACQFQLDEHGCETLLCHSRTSEAHAASAPALPPERRLLPGGLRPGTQPPDPCPITEMSVFYACTCDLTRFTCGTVLRRGGY